MPRSSGQAAGGDAAPYPGGDAAAFPLIATRNKQISEAKVWDTLKASLLGEEGDASWPLALVGTHWRWIKHPRCDGSSTGGS